MDGTNSTPSIERWLERPQIKAMLPLFDDIFWPPVAAQPRSGPTPQVARLDVGASMRAMWAK